MGSFNLIFCTEQCWGEISNTRRASLGLLGTDYINMPNFGNYLCTLRCVWPRLQARKLPKSLPWMAFRRPLTDAPELKSGKRRVKMAINKHQADLIKAVSSSVFETVDSKETSSRLQGGIPPCLEGQTGDNQQLVNSHVC